VTRANSPRAQDAAPNLVKILSRLEDDGVLKRKRSARDKRAVELSLSAAGPEARDEATGSARPSMPHACPAQQIRQTAFLRCWHGWSKATGAQPEAPSLGAHPRAGIQVADLSSSRHRHGIGAPRQHRALVDVALVGDLTAVADAGRRAAARAWRGRTNCRFALSTL